MSEYNRGERPVTAAYPENVHTPDQAQLINDRLAQLFRKVDQTDFYKRNDKQERLSFSVRRVEDEIVYFITHRHNNTDPATYSQSETCYVLSAEKGEKPRLDCFLRDGSAEAHLEEAMQDFYANGRDYSDKDRADFKAEIIHRQSIIRQEQEHEMVSAIGHASASMDDASRLNELVFYSITRW